MDWLIGSALVFAGLMAGLLVGKLLFSAPAKTEQDKEAVKSEKQLIAEQAQIHITESQAALAKIQEQCQQLNNQLHHYQTVIEETTKEDDPNKLEYFNQQASLHLKTQKKEPKKERKTDYQPLDYSEGQSGLFAGDAKKHSETS